MSVKANHMRELGKAAERRLCAAREERAAFEDLKAAVRAARADGVPAIWISEAIGTTRQRVYEILRES